ncbi:MAG: threonine ammonia-lyase [Desulfurococcales archaeon]|nr:threonine ammonia-lyase [Desulfurococcales archaeon]
MDELVNDIVQRSREALRVIRDYVHKTPIEASSTFSRLANGKVYLKYENLQKTGAFKVRGALYKVYKIKDKYDGVVAASAGNHAQGVAYAASVFGLKSIIVMPVGAPIAKIEATKGYGAEVVLAGSVFDETLKAAQKIAEEKGYYLVHAFNDPDVIAGQGTIAFEIMEQLDSFDQVLVPVGGGGLISGIGSVLKKYRPYVKIIGVEPSVAPKATRALQERKLVTIKPGVSIADGLIVKTLGDLTFKIMTKVVDSMITVEEDEIAHAIYLLLERGKVLSEGAGAVPLAALLYGRVDTRDKTSVAIISGGNIDLTHIYRIILRGLGREGRLARIAGYVPDAPGQLRRVLEVIASNRGNVIGIQHDRIDPRLPAWHAKVIVTFEAPGRDKIKMIVKTLREEGYEFWEEDSYE